MNCDVSILPCGGDGAASLPVVRWQVRVDPTTAAHAKALAAVADLTLQAVLLGAVRYQAEAAIGCHVAGYLTPLRTTARYAPTPQARQGRTRPVIRIPRWWVDVVIPQACAAMGTGSPNHLVRLGINGIWRGVFAACGAAEHQGFDLHTFHTLDPALAAAAVRAEVTPSRRAVHAEGHKDAA